jgi:hypothetical protein
MNLVAIAATLNIETSCGYLAQNAAQISRNALASGFPEMKEPWANAQRLMDNPG